MSNWYVARTLGLVGLTGLLLPVLTTQQAAAAPAGPDYNYTITPCRVLDTRQAVGVFAGALQPGESIDIRTWGTSIPIQGGSGTQCPDIPSDATGLYVNVIAVDPSGSVNWISAKPYGTEDNSTAVNYNQNSGAIGNSQLLGTCYGQWYWGGQGTYNCSSFDLTFENGPNASAHLVIDVTGFTRYY